MNIVDYNLRKAFVELIGLLYKHGWTIGEFRTRLIKDFGCESVELHSIGKRPPLKDQIMIRAKGKDYHYTYTFNDRKVSFKGVR